MKKFTRVEARLVYQNKYIELYDDAVLTPSGAAGTFTRFRYRGNTPGVVCVPRVPDGRYLLIEAYCYAFDSVSLEFPRGTGELGEAAEAAARRELLRRPPSRRARLGASAICARTPRSSRRGRNLPAGRARQWGRRRR